MIDLLQRIQCFGERRACSLPILAAYMPPSLEIAMGLRCVPEVLQ
jgi:hypothetical protein